jgi:oleate hydratase
MAVYQLLGIERQIPPIKRHDKTLEVMLAALVKAA